MRSYGTEFALAFDRELVPNVAVAALNLIYQPEWTRVVGTGAAEQESTIGAALGLMVQARPGFFLGGEARYLRQIRRDRSARVRGPCLFVGPTAYLQLSKRYAADGGLERPGMGASGRLECRPRSRQFRTPPGAAGIRR